MTWSGSRLSYLGQLMSRMKEKPEQVCRQVDAAPPSSMCLLEAYPVFCGLAASTRSVRSPVYIKLLTNYFGHII